MRDLEVKKIDVFTTKPFCGNPAGVITEGDGLSTESMQGIAAVMNLSESCFVSAAESSSAMFRVRFFTQSDQLDISGHALIAACFALVEDGMVPLIDGETRIHIETKVGSLPVDIHFRRYLPEDAPGAGGGNGVALAIGGGNAGTLERIMIHQSRELYRPATIPIKELAGVLDIDEGEILRTGLPLEIVSCGLEQFMIPVMHKETILGMQPDLIKLNLLNQRFGIQTNDILTLDSVSDDCVTYSRHFAPAIGLWEDLGSGNGAGSIAAYLHRHGVINQGSIIMEQGKDTDRLSRIFVEIGQPDDGVLPVRIGGLAVTSITHKLNVRDGEFIIA